MCFGRSSGIVFLMFLVSATGTVRRAEAEGGTQSQRLTFDAKRSQWVELPSPEAGTAEGDLALARAQFASDEFRPARGSINAWLKLYGAASELYPKAILLQGRIEKALHNHYVAYETLTPLIDDYSGTPEATDAAVELFNIAEIFLTGVRRKVWGIPLLSAEDVALNILDDLSIQFPDSALAEQAVKTKADYHFKQGDFGLAELEYARLTQSFPSSRYGRFAMRRGADSALASFGGIDFDDAPLIEAEERYRIYTQQYRGLAEQEQIGLILENIRETRAGKELSIGGYYERTKHPRAAVYYYRSTIKHWPDTIAARKAGDALTHLGESPFEPTEKESTGGPPQPPAVESPVPAKEE